MKNAVSFVLNGREIVAKELSVLEVDNLFKKIRSDDYELHNLDLLIDSDLPFDLVLASTGEPEESFVSASVMPSDLVDVYKAVEKANPGFAAMAARLSGKLQEKTGGQKK